MNYLICKVGAFILTENQRVLLKRDKKISKITLTNY